MNERLRNNEMYGMQRIFDSLYADSRNGSNFYHLYDKIISRENILLAYRNLRINSGSNTPGVDGRTMLFLDKMTDDALVDMIQKKLHNYQPGWVRRVMIPKKSGGKRPLGIPTITDRLIQQCFLQILDPISEAKFYRYSYGFRPCRSAIHALSRVVSLINRGKMYYCVDVNIKSFFDTVDHGRMMRQLWSFGIRDKRVLSIIGKMLKSPVCGAGVPEKGTMQGGILSPLLANIYLDELDHWVETQWEKFPADINIHAFHNTTGKRSNLKSGYIVRYADDFKIMCRSYDDAVRFNWSVRKYIQENLLLAVNEDKSAVVNLKRKSTDFLGFNIKVVPKGGTKNGWVARTKMSEDAVKHVSENIKYLIKKIQCHSFDAKYVQEYNAAVIGAKSYYQYATDVYCDMDRIGMSVIVVMKNRLKNRGYWSTCREQDAEYRKRNIGIRPDTRVMMIQGMPMDIINGIAYRNPMNFQQDMTPYTKIGREKMECGNIRVHEEYLKYIADSTDNKNMPVEYLNNRLSKYVCQKGVCPVLGIQFHPKDMECHHMRMKKRKGQNGDHSFRNLVWLYRDVHILIHATNDEVIKKYLDILRLTEKQLLKVNEYRKKIDNKVIVNC